MSGRVETGDAESFGLLHVHDMVRTHVVAGTAARKVFGPLEELTVGPLDNIERHSPYSVDARTVSESTLSDDKQLADPGERASHIPR